MIYNNKRLRFVLFTILFIAILYFYRVLSFTFGRIIFDSFSFNIDIPVQKSRILLQFCIDFLYVILVYAISKNKWFADRINSFLKKALLVIPFLTDLSDIIHDKTCWKPWLHFNDIIWYFPLRLVLWSFIFYLIKYKSDKLSKTDYLILVISVVSYTIIKQY